MHIKKMKKEIPVCIVCKTGNKNKEYFYYYIGVYGYGSFLICKKCLKNHKKIFFNNNKKLIKKFTKELLAPYILKASEIQLKNYPKKYKKIGISKIFNQTVKAIHNESKIRDINAFNWQKYAKKSLSELYDKREHESFYLFVFDFFIAIDKACERKDFKLIKRIFKFAEKCCKSKSYYISNAISVSFYENITDHPNIEHNLKLIPRDIIKNSVIPLTKWIRPKNYKKLMLAIKKNKTF